MRHVVFDPDPSGRVLGRGGVGSRVLLKGGLQDAQFKANLESQTEFFDILATPRDAILHCL